MQQNGYEICFTRRRYGRKMFTWIYVRIGNKWQSTGDPLPKIMPSRIDIEEAIKRAQIYFDGDKKKVQENVSQSQ